MKIFVSFNFEFSFYFKQACLPSLEFSSQNLNA